MLYQNPMTYFLLPHKDDVFEENDSLLKSFSELFDTVYYTRLNIYLFIYCSVMKIKSYILEWIRVIK